MLDSELLERIAARRAELDHLEAQLTEQLATVRSERDELAVAKRVLERVSEEIAGERASASPPPGQVAGRAVMLPVRRQPALSRAVGGCRCPGLEVQCWEARGADEPRNRGGGVVSAGCGLVQYVPAESGLGPLDGQNGGRPAIAALLV